MKLPYFSSPVVYVYIFLILFSGVLSPGGAMSQETTSDTVFGFNFQVNMTKAVEEGIFRPDSDFVYVVLDQGISAMSLVPGPSYTYSAIVTNGIDSGNTYHYKFRINDTLWETVNRSATTTEGITTIKTWWNKLALNYTAFVIDMTYSRQSGQFDPATDTVQVLGTMNGWAGSPPLHRIDTTLSYFIIYTLDPGSIQQYKFRINSDSSGLELLNKPNRMLRIPDTLLEAVHFFNNYDPATLPMTFNCDMEYYLRAVHFDPLNDFLDVAGNFNGWGANDVLFDPDNDSVYTLVIYLDTAYTHNGPLQFKFRINGNWNTAELYGKPNRIYPFHDTVGQNPNIFNSWYDDKNPSVPTRPWAFNVAIQGKLENHQVLSGMYSYEDVNGRPEDSTTFQWYRCDDQQMTNLTPIDTAERITYTIDTLDIGKYLAFEVIVKATGGDSATGYPVRVVSVSKVGNVGIGEMENLISMVYPNPTSGIANLLSLKDLINIEVLNLYGQRVMQVDASGRKLVSLDLGILPKGIYILKAFTREKETGIARIIRN
ncbi:MAG: T9SS type A sorting domain-containing protein [bacterium]